MSLFLVLLLSNASIEQQADAVVRERFENIGRRVPTRDPRLDAAARKLSAEALARGSELAVGFFAVTSAVSEAKAGDPSPIVIMLKGRGASLLQSLADQPFSRDAPATHYGLGLTPGSGDVDALCVLLSRRLFEVEAVPRKLTKASSSVLCGVPLVPITSAEVYVTIPAGAVESQPLRRDKTKYCSTIHFAQTGRHTVEILTKSERGPEVASLFFVEVGNAAASSEVDSFAEETDADKARISIIAAINRLRAAFSLTNVEASTALDSVASAYATQLDSENFFAHVAPDGATLKDRLNRAQYNYLSAGENLGLAQGPMAAHFGIEHSPGHRQNLLDPRFTNVGIGLHKSASGRWLLVEILAAPAQTFGERDKDPAAAVYDALNAFRQRKGLPHLKRNSTLDGLAQAHAVAAQQFGRAQVEIPSERPLPERVFELLDNAASAAVDVFVSESLSLTPASKNLNDKRNRLVGIGVVKPSDDRYWFVVLYASPKP
jgi:uncharacterized protein YkwD